MKKPIIAVTALFDDKKDSIWMLPVYLEVGAITDDGLIESIYLKNKKFVLGVQWHPELLYKDFKIQFSIFKAFIDSCI